MGITDSGWSSLLAANPSIQEINFWQPGGKKKFSALSPGELFLFKPHGRNFIIGGGIFTYSTLLPVSLAWDAFGKGNGVDSLMQMRRSIERYRKSAGPTPQDYTIGCIILTRPFFFQPDEAVPLPDWNKHIVSGKQYNATAGPGVSLYNEVTIRIQASHLVQRGNIIVGESQPRYGPPTLIQPRVGQGTFRVLVTDAYDRKCALTGEKVLPVLQAAHIKPYSDGGTHEIDNGLLLRSDLHTLFDRGYVTISPDYHVEVSRRIREDYENGAEYYALHGSHIRDPRDGVSRPSKDNLSWHNSNTYLG